MVKVVGRISKTCEKVSSERNTRSRMATTAETAPRLGTTPAVRIGPLPPVRRYVIDCEFWRGV